MLFQAFDLGAGKTTINSTGEEDALQGLHSNWGG